MKISGKHIFKIIGWIIFVLFLLIIGTGTFVYFKAESYINNNLSNIVTEKSDGLYELTFEEIKLEIKPVSVTVSAISLEPNKQKSNEILKNQPNKTFYSFRSPELKISDLHIFELFKNHLFYSKDITVIQPEFEILGGRILQNDSTKNMEKFFHEFRPLFQKLIKKVVVDEINFVEANYKSYHSISDFTEVSNARKLSIAIKKFRTDSAMIFNNSQFFESDDILVSINQFQNNLSDSIHILKIDTLEYSLKTTDIYANGFHLTHKEKSRNRNLYDVQVPHLHVKSKSIASLSLNDSLKIQYLEFNKPQIRFYQKKDQKKIRIEDINQFNLYSLIENQFSEIKIDTFVLTNANIKIFQQPDTTNYQQHFELVTISLNGFQLDSTSAKNKDKLFHADNLNMFVNGYHLRLKDNQHEFISDSMFVSTTSNTLGLKNISIFPTVHDNIKSRTSVNVSCEDLSIDNVNLKTLFHTRKLPTRRISITKPNVQVQYHTEIAKAKEKRETGLLFNLVLAYSKGVYSEFVEIENGSLNIKNLKNNNLQGYFETNFDFKLSGFALDSASNEQTDKFFYASNFDLLFTDYKMKLVDNLHKIDVERISIQSFDRKLEIENLSFKPIVSNAILSTMQSFNRSELYNISIPKITLWGINLRDAFFYNKLNIDKFQVSKPKVYFEHFGILRKKKEKTDFSELYQLASNYIYDFNIQEITIPSGNFTWINHTKKGNTTSFDNEFSATLKGFRLNEEELNKQRLFFSDNFDISVKDQMFQLSDSVHILNAGEINVSSEKSSVYIKDALLYPVITSGKYNDLSTTFQVSIPELQVSNIDFLKAYYSKELNLSTLILNSPKFNVYSKTGISKSLDLNKFQFPLPAFIKSLHLNELKINNADVINYEIVGLEHHAQSNFNIDLVLPNVSLKNDENNQAKITTENIILNINNFKTPLGKRHELEIGELDFNREQKTISIEKLKVIPFAKKNSGNTFSISAPQLKFSGFNINSAIKNNSFVFDEIEIKNPEIAIEISDSIKGDKLEFAKNLDLYPYIESYVNEIKVQHLQLQNIDLNFNWFEKELIDKRFNLRFNDIYIAENAKSENLLNSKEFELSTSNLKTTSSNGFYEFSADSLIYNSAKHNTLLKNIQVSPLFSSDEFHKKIDFQTDYLSVKTDYIELKDVDENYWLEENILKAKTLIIGKTDLDIYRNKRFQFNQNQRPPWPQDLIKEIKQPFVFDSVYLLPSTIKYSELLDFSDEPGFITFDNLAVKTGKISNIAEVTLQNPKLHIDASAKLYNQGLLSFHATFDLTKNNYTHTISGSLSPMSLTHINNILEKSVPVSLESGQLSRLDFDLKLNDKLATGTLYLGYNDFKINILDFDYEGSKKAKFATFWANKMVLNSKNPKGDEFLPTTISYERDIQRSILNYWWKAIFTGSKETLGIKPEKSK
jgi:hypothetical protein